MSYIILEYFTSCSEENILASGGWFETDYQKLIEEDVGYECANFHSEEEARKEWLYHYSGTEFYYSEKENSLWSCRFYVLCFEDDEDGNIEILEISSGNLNIEDIEHNIYSINQGV